MLIQDKKILKLFLLPLVFFINQNAHALKWTAEAGMHTGGDEISVLNTNGNPDSFKAGELMTMAIGPQIALSTTSNIRMMFGWKFNAMHSMNSSSDNIKFTRYPIDVMYFYQTKKWNFGAGLSYHLNPEVSGVLTNLKYDDALGYSVEIDYRFMGSFYMGGRYTTIDYKQETTGAKIDGSSIGFVMGIVFGK
ncbi:MAG: hypothetical protein ACC653_12190 [Gammaproteobacteria bacterium]